MKENRKQILLLIIGIICLPAALYKYYTAEGSDLKHLIGVVLSAWLIYDYYIYKTNKHHVLDVIKEFFSSKEGKL